MKIILAYLLMYYVICVRHRYIASFYINKTKAVNRLKIDLLRVILLFLCLLVLVEVI